MLLPTLIAAGSIVVLNLVASIYVARAPRYEIRQKIAQFVLIWLVPLFGALLCSYFLYQDRKAVGRQTGDGSRFTTSDAEAISRGIGR